MTQESGLINLIPRNSYIEKIKHYLDKPVIKVLIGMRRTGKSSLMKLTARYLLEKGVPEKNIVYINKESLEFDEIKTYKDLYKYVISKLSDKGGKKYIFIDEVQEIEQWERAVTSFFSDNIGDIIISGSNSKILSSELSTLLSGRYVEIPIYPLSFGEFLDFRKNRSDTDSEFLKYIKYGGLPSIHHLELNDEVVYLYLNSLLNAIIYKDVVSRYKIRDTSTLERVVKYLFDNIGNITTAKRIADFFKSQKIKISVDTVINYINYLESAILISKASRYDLKGKKVLELYDKIFLSDIGLRNGLIGYKEKDINGILENIVYNELLFRGYKVFIGKISNMEVDFVAVKQKETKYIQVCYLLASDGTIEGEFGVLKKIPDNYEKIVISMDKVFPDDIDGIKHKYIVDFLLETVLSFYEV